MLMKLMILWLMELLRIFSLNSWSDCPLFVHLISGQIQPRKNLVSRITEITSFSLSHLSWRPFKKYWTKFDIIFLLWSYIKTSKALGTCQIVSSISRCTVLRTVSPSSLCQYFLEVNLKVIYANPTSNNKLTTPQVIDMPYI